MPNRLMTQMHEHCGRIRRWEWRRMVGQFYGAGFPVNYDYEPWAEKVGKRRAHCHVLGTFEEGNVIKTVWFLRKQLDCKTIKRFLGLTMPI
jgi:hypothetical protein